MNDAHVRTAEEAPPNHRSTAARSLSVLRLLPFAVMGTLSLWAAGRAPAGRKPFELDLDLSAHAFSRAMSKVPHLKHSALLCALALLGLGLARWRLALMLVVLIGVGWELAETTVVGHNARVADITPDIVGASVTVLLVLGAARLAQVLRPNRGR